MPFSMAQQKNCTDEQLNARCYSLKKLSKISVTLQVRIKENKNMVQGFGICHGKKAFLPASLTLEAALSLSLFIFAVVCMMLPMKIMNTERKIQAALEAVGEDFSQYAYLKDMIENGKTADVPGAGEFAKSFCGHLGAGAAEGYAQLMVVQHLDTKTVRHVRMLRSEILEDGEMFDLMFDYEIQLPFPVLGVDSLERTARSRRRAWIGKTGKDGSFRSSGEGDEDEIVYVGINSTRYHRSQACHYLSNNLIPVSYEEALSLRNDSGGKYYACRACGAGAGAGATVYIMPSGTSYHTMTNCKAINAYVRAVRLSEVIHLGPCSYCSK